MSNFLEDILAAVGEEQITHISVPKPFWEDKGKESTKHLQGSVHNWEEVKHYFNYEYDDGFGSMDCDDIVFWTETKVFYIYEYDGSTSICWVPRNPEVVENSYKRS